MAPQPIKQLQFDASRRAALALVEVVSPLLRPEERSDAQGEFFAVIFAAIADYERRRAELS